MSDLKWMLEAYQLAEKAQCLGEVPVGAVLVDEQDHLIGRGWNSVIQSTDPSAHAEMLALREAAATIHNHRLCNTTLYVTLEPCCMCAGALVQARVKRVVFATRDLKAGAAGSRLNVLHGDLFNHAVMIDEGILQVECAALLSQFFKVRR